MPGPAPDALDSWPGVADHAIARLSPEHLSVGWYVGLLIAAVGAVIAGKHFLGRLLGPAPVPPPAPPPHASLTADQIQDAAAAGAARTINGSLDRIERRLAEMSKQMQAIDDKGDQRHEQNIQRLTALEAGGRHGGAAPWSGRERRQAPVD